MVLAIVAPKLHWMPLTFLESPDMGRPFNDQQLRMISNIRQPKLRDIAFFVMTFADGNRVTDISFFNNMAKYLIQLSIPDIRSAERRQGKRCVSMYSFRCSQ